ncbi:MAG: glutaredoxin family protein [Bacteroidetes bacterium]|nr:glutaredoxin family protein [Bacteroidota bacterium]
MKDVLIYTSPTCHFCHMAKDFFNANNVKFTEKNVADGEEIRNEVIEKSGQMGVPVIFIGEDMVIGYNEPKIKSLLGL